MTWQKFGQKWFEFVKKSESLSISKFFFIYHVRFSCSVDFPWSVPWLQLNSEDVPDRKDSNLFEGLCLCPSAPWECSLPFSVPCSRYVAEIFFKTRGCRISISLSFSRCSMSSWVWWCAGEEETADLCDSRPPPRRLHVHLHRLLLGCKKGDRHDGELSSLRKWLQLLSQLPPLPQVLLVTSHSAYFWHCLITISHIHSKISLTYLWHYSPKPISHILLHILLPQVRPDWV